MKLTVKTLIISSATALSLTACTSEGGMDTASASDTTPVANTSAKDNPVVGGAEMYPSYTIVQNASNASNLSTLVKAVSAAGLVDTLNGPGPFTVFAPNNAAFDRLAPGTLDTLLMPENKASLTKILTTHVVAGDMTGKMLMAKIKAGGGKAMIKTVAGSELTLTVVNGDIAVTDPAGMTAYVQIADIEQKNGVVHVINGVLLPKS